MIGLDSVVVWNLSWSGICCGLESVVVWILLWSGICRGLESVVVWNLSWSGICRGLASVLDRQGATSQLGGGRGLMLPHYPALLLLLVSSGGADFPPPSHSWKDNYRLPSPRSHPSPGEEGHIGREEYEQSSTTSGRGAPTSSKPEIKVRDEALPDDVGGPWEKPTIRSKYGNEQINITHSAPRLSREGYSMVMQFRRHSLPNIKVSLHQPQHNLTQSHRLQSQTVSHSVSRELPEVGIANVTDRVKNSSQVSQVVHNTLGTPWDVERFLPNDNSIPANITGRTNIQQLQSFRRKFRPVNVSGSETQKGDKITASGLLEGVVPQPKSPETNLARDHISSNKIQDSEYVPEFAGGVRRVFLNAISAVASRGDKTRERRQHDKRVNEVSPGYASKASRSSDTSHADHENKWHKGGTQPVLLDKYTRVCNNDNNSITMGEEARVVQLKQEMGNKQLRQEVSEQLKEDVSEKLRQETDEKLRKRMGQQQLRQEKGGVKNVSSNPSFLLSSLTTTTIPTTTIPPSTIPTTTIPTTTIPPSTIPMPRPLFQTLSEGVTSQTRGLHGNISFDELSEKNVSVNKNPQRTPKLNEASPHPDVKLKISTGKRRGTRKEENIRNTPLAQTPDNNNNIKNNKNNNNSNNSNKNSKNLLIRGDRAAGGWDKEGPEALWRQKRNAKEVGKNESLPIGFQSGGEGVYHSSRDDSSQITELRWRQGIDRTSFDPPHFSQDIDFKGSEDGKQIKYRASAISSITGRQTKKQDKYRKNAIKPASQNNGVVPSRPRDKSSLEAGTNFLYKPEDEKEERTSTSKSFLAESHPSSGEEEEEEEEWEEKTWEEDTEDGTWENEDEVETWEEEEEEDEGEETWEEDNTWKNGDETTVEEALVAGDQLVRQKRERWPASVTIDTPYNAWNLTQTPPFPLPKYYRVYTETFPGVYTSYILPDINAHDNQHQASVNPPFSPSDDPEDDDDIDDIQGVTYRSQGDELELEDRRASRSLALHATRASSVRVNKHVRGDRSFVKAPQQRHARSRNRAKRKGKCCANIDMTPPCAS
ncbi:hypothetical protein Pcinc_044132 [Petrolisthes cinctipes]|uniref:Uncharacterized protein n=1 Tax=Petrolisthes cinctipes TaxID=88211 RepID=A0AAE1BHQ1_PETCI|nr:hypothetical protein Pcinc_044132 [Petrolisthes cinctipes]